MKTVYIALMLTIMIAYTQAITPQWIANNQRLAAYNPLLWWVPGIGKFSGLSLLAYSYLGIIGFYGQYDLVVKFFNDFVEVYYPMSGISLV